MILRAPAKINLYLRVLGKRPDGYHNIETLFERIALYDRIALRSLKTRTIKIFSDHPAVPTGKSGLIYRAVKLIQEKCRVSEGAEVKIFKRIPVASGLGGGSSDAASVLRGLSRLWRVSLGSSSLAELAGRLGADIPFFLSERSFAFARKRGDKIIPLGWKAKLWHLLICPPVAMSSKVIYGAYSPAASSGLTKKLRFNKILSLDRLRVSSFARGGVRLSNIRHLMRNDLEGAVFKKAAVVSGIKDALEGIGIRYSLVSGSGPSVFSVFRERKEAVRARELLFRRFGVVKQRGWKVFIVETL